MGAESDYYDRLRRRLLALPKEQLVGMLEDAAKNWLAHDGLWFLAVEEAGGMETAIRCDIRAWEQFSAVEAQRILQRHALPPHGGLETLEIALGYRLYAFLNVQEIRRVDERTLLFRMNECRVQSARKRKGLPAFPCKPVGLVEYSVFARTIDPRIRTRCIACPPDEHPEDFWCAWEFTIE